MKVAVTKVHETLYSAEVIHELAIQRFTTVARVIDDETRSLGFRAEKETMAQRQALRELRLAIAKKLGLPVEEVELV